MNIHRHRHTFIILILFLHDCKEHIWRIDRNYRGLLYVGGGLIAGLPEFPTSHSHSIPIQVSHPHCIHSHLGPCTWRMAHHSRSTAWQKFSISNISFIPPSQALPNQTNQTRKKNAHPHENTSVRERRFLRSLRRGGKGVTASGHPRPLDVDSLGSFSAVSTDGRDAIGTSGTVDVCEADALA